MTEKAFSQLVQCVASESSAHFRLVALFEKICNTSANSDHSGGVVVGCRYWSGQGVLWVQQCSMVWKKGVTQNLSKLTIWFCSVTSVKHSQVLHGLVSHLSALILTYWD